MEQRGGRGWRQPAAPLCAGLGSLGIIIGLTRVPVSATFSGGCAATDGSHGLCVIDEPVGRRPAPHGTATYQIVGSSLAFGFSPVGGVTDMKVCVLLNTGQPSPFVPTKPTSCTGTSRSKRYDGAYRDLYTYDLSTLPGWRSGSSVYFAVHFGQRGQSTYIVGDGSSGTTPAAGPLTTAGLAGAAPIAVVNTPATDGALDLGWLAPVGVVLVLVGGKLRRVTSGPTDP